MAQVYLALDTRLGRKVALKILAPQLGLDAEFVRRFEREARVAAGLSHPAIVTVYDSDEHHGLLYMTMEYIDGRSLHSILKEHGALGIGYAVSLLGPVAQALDYAHRQGAVHRDVKPHNVLVATDGRVLLADFGIVQPLDTTGERLTRTGIFMGTPEYVSPEQLEARHVGGGSDLYSLGIVGYEILTGRVPFSGSTPQLILAHTQTPPPPLRQMAPALPPELEDVFEQVLAKDPQERYQSGEAFVQEIMRVMKGRNIPQASTAQIAALAVSEASSAGNPTIGLTPDPTPAASTPPPQARPASPPPPAAVPNWLQSAAESPRPAAPPPESGKQPSTPPPPPDKQPSAAPPPPPPSPSGTPEPQADTPPPPRKTIPYSVWFLLLVVLISVLVALYFLSPIGGNGGEERLTRTEPPTATPMVVLATNTPVVLLATNTPVVLLATDTPAPPTDTPTDTPVPPTPTDTPVPPTPTDTPVPSVPSDTPLPPAPTDIPYP
jgi:serine/threonine-protein kinase